jgi:hypothetical protein
MQKNNSIRVLHCPNMIGGNPQMLARSERELGLQSWSVSFERTIYDYDVDEFLGAVKYNAAAIELKRWPLLLRAMFDYDIIHFNFGQTIFPQQKPPRTIWHRLYNAYAASLEMKDLLLLKKIGKGIVVTFQGDDARQGDYCLANFKISPAHELGREYYPPALDRNKRDRIAMFSRYADRIYALNPDLLYVLPPSAQFLPYSHIDLRDWRVTEKKDTPQIPVVVHAPSHRGVKGTKYIINAVTRLKSEGVALRFILVEGLPHNEARRLYESADLLIDQLFCGWYGGLAVELMALGKPVMSYIREQDLKFIPDQMQKDLPVISITPDTVYFVLKDWLTKRKHQLANIGHKSRLFVEAWHNPLKVAEAVKEDYQMIMLAKG